MSEVEVTGVLRDGKTIQLDERVPLPDGSPVRVRLLVDSAEARAAEDARADETLGLIARLRKAGGHRIPEP